MQSGGRTWSYAVAALGAIGLLVSLWLPWYSFTIPPAFIDQAEGVAGQFGVLAPVITQGAELARHLGELHVSAWRVLSQIDIVLALAAGLAGGSSLLSIANRASGTGRLIAGVGALALALCAYRVIVPPGPAELLHPSSGAYLALGSSLAMLTGGWLAGSEITRGPMAPAPPWTIDASPARPLHASVTRSASSVAPPPS